MPTPWKMPPLIKVYEALGSLGDGRVRIIDEEHALVTSSEGDRTYEVETRDGGHELSSSDNASYWQGYVGYPAIAVLLRRGLIPLPPGARDALAGIPWNELNRRFKRDYSKTLAEVERKIEQAGHAPDAVRAEAEAVLRALRALAPYRGKRLRPAREAP
jgi:hypothetical protein